MMDDFSQDICRVCRCEAQSDRPLFYPCICTGSIKYIHQDCLMQWMRYSHKEYCELCGHRFSFQPIYSPDMPRVLPLRDVAGGLLSAVMKAAKYWFHYSLVGIAWFGIVPLSAYRTYRFMFSGSTFDMILTLPFDIFSTENIAQDALRGCFVVTCTLLSFIGLVWLREQILHGGGPDWLERDEAVVAGNEADEGPAALPNAAARNAAAAEGPADIGVDAAANAPPLDLNNDNHNLQEAPVDVPMDNEAPAQPNPVYEGYEPDFVLGRRIHAAPQAANNENAPAAVAAPAAAEQNNDNDNDEPNWNPMEWDRAAEELTWERLLGLDGSMVFMEHVFWIISLNTMFIFTFAFCPYCIGNFVINWLSVWQPEKPLLHFHGLTTTLFGYCNIGFTLVVLHYFAHLFKMSRVRWLLGLCFIVVKVSLLAVVEIGLLPLVSGWWLDICSLPLFDASLNDRKTSFRAGPGTSLFIHWMFGMVYVYYFAAFISLLREVVRPGVLWFLRNLNDPDFSPIQEMIHLPILRHVRRLIASAIIFGCTVLLMLWLPIRILKTIWPNFLPYTLSGDSEVNELSLQLLLLQVILPGFFEQSHTRIWMKALLRLWCICVSWVLGIRSYLLGTGPVLENEQNGAQRDNHQAMAGAGAAARPARNLNLAAEHNAFLQRDVPVGFQSYDKPTFFPIRLFGLLLFMCVSLVIASLVTLTVPVWIGRQVMALWSVGSHIANQDVVQNSDELPRAHELYTAAIGTYLCWITSRAIAIAVTLLPQGRAAVVNKLKQWLKVGVSYALPAFIFVLLLGVIPLLFGLILELVLVIPMRVPFYQTPIHFLWQDWALGVLYTKIAIALTLMGPDWRIKRALERAYRDGLREIDLTFIIRDLAKPVITCFGLALAIPYVIAHSLFPIFFTDPMARFEISRGIYPIFLIIVVVVGFIYFEIRQFKKLYVAIKVDKYLVGQRLVNYEHRRRRQEAEAAAAATIDKGVQTAAGVDAYGIDDNAENIVGVVAEGQLPLARGGDADIEQQQREAQINNILMGEQLL